MACVEYQRTRSGLFVRATLVSSVLLTRALSDPTTPPFLPTPQTHTSYMESEILNYHSEYLLFNSQKYLIST